MVEYISVFETLPKIDLRGTTLVSPNIVDPVFMGTPKLDGQSMVGGQLVYSTSWNENTTTVEYTGFSLWTVFTWFLYALSGSPGWDSTYMQFLNFNGVAYTGANDYNSTSEWLEAGSTTATLNDTTYAGFEPGLWLSGNGTSYWHSGIYWIIPGAIRNNLGGSTYDPTKSASDAGGPFTPSIMVRGESYLYRDGSSIGYYREEGGGIYTNADTSVSGFRLIGANSSHTIGTGSSNGWLSVWRFKRRV